MRSKKGIGSLVIIGVIALIVISGLFVVISKEREPVIIPQEKILELRSDCIQLFGATNEIMFLKSKCESCGFNFDEQRNKCMTAEFNGYEVYMKCPIGSNLDRIKAGKIEGGEFYPLIGGVSCNGCIAGAGYTWCESLQKCVRTWEEKCPLLDCETDRDCASGYCIAGECKEFEYSITI